jgi:type II secretory pathway component PulL
MPLYTKNGSIPSPQTDGTEGWVLVGDKPTCPDGKEVVWLNWEWIVRDPKPTDSEGYQWNWNHGDKAWVECALPQFEKTIDLETIETDLFTITDLSALSTTQIQLLTTAQVKSLTK